MTGGGGYIGSHACKALASAGHVPIVYDNFISGRPSAVKWGPSESGDICDKRRLSQILSHYNPDAVMHFAAFAYVGESIVDPAKYYYNNVFGTMSLLDSMVSHGVRKIVSSSSCATYGVPEVLPIAEHSRQAPINPYGASKLMVERMLDDYVAAYGLQSVSLRYFNAAGADPEGEIGEDHDPETHLIPLVLMAAAGGAPVTVFGTDYDTPDGTCIRDYVHVSDVAHAHVLALEVLCEGARSATYNLGSGSGASVMEIIESARRITGKEISPLFDRRRPGDPPVLLADIRQSAVGLGWRPVHDLDAMISTAWAWYTRAGRIPRGGPPFTARQSASAQ